MMASFGSLWDNRRKDKQTKSNPFVVVNWPALLVLFIPFCFVNSPRSLSLPTGSFKHQLLFLSSLSLSLGKLKMVSMLGKKYKKVSPAAIAYLMIDLSILTPIHQGTESGRGGTWFSFTTTQPSESWTRDILQSSLITNYFFVCLPRFVPFHFCVKVRASS